MLFCHAAPSRKQDLVAFVAIAWLAVVIGCIDEDVSDKSGAEPALVAEVALRLVVVDDVEMADAIRRRRNVWSGSLEVDEMTSAELIAGADILHGSRSRRRPARRSRGLRAASAPSPGRRPHRRPP